MSSWERHDSSRSRSSRPPDLEHSSDHQSAYLASSTSFLSTSAGQSHGHSHGHQTRPQNLSVPSGSGHDDTRSTKKKSSSLRSLIRRRPSESREDHQHSHGRSLSHTTQSQHDFVRSAPPTSRTFPQTVQRSISQPPALSRSVSAHQSSLTQYAMPSFGHELSTVRRESSNSPWDPVLGPRPALTYPQSPWDSQSPQARSYSYYEPSRQSSPWDPIPSEPSQLSQQHQHQQHQHQQHQQQPQPVYQAYQPPQQQSQFTSTQRTAFQSRPSLSEGLDDPSDFHLFVEATSGLPDSNFPFSLTSPQSPPNPRPNFSISRRPVVSPPQIQTTFDDRPLPLPTLQSRSAVALRGPSNPLAGPGIPSIAPEPSPHPTNYPLSAHPQSRSSRTPSQRLADQMEGISGDEEEVPPDDELPDYAQSQAEENRRRRREASSRAAELERRWEAARRGNR